MIKSFSIDDFRIKSDTDFENLPTHYDLESKKSKIEEALLDTRRELGELQNKQYAHSKYSVLVCIQGMDTAGKDSLIREVFKDFNVRGVDCYSFKKPTPLELRHDFLWRHYIKLPERGKYTVFNRSHYENVLITRVHPSIILNENQPHINSIEDIDEHFWSTRIRQINQFEQIISENGTIIFKFFLNISKEEQKRRLLRRLNKPEKNWKFNAGDLEERKKWDDYQNAYKEALRHTSKDHSPWYNIPADDKPTARYIVAKILKEKMSSFSDITYPQSELSHDVEYYKSKLENED